MGEGERWQKYSSWWISLLSAIRLSSFLLSLHLELLKVHPNSSHLCPLSLLSFHSLVHFQYSSREAKYFNSQKGESPGMNGWIDEWTKRSVNGIEAEWREKVSLSHPMPTMVDVTHTICRQEESTFPPHFASLLSSFGIYKIVPCPSSTLNTHCYSLSRIVI